MGLHSVQYMIVLVPDGTSATRKDHMSTSRTSTQPLPVASVNVAAALIQQLHALEKHDTDDHASEYFQAQPDDRWAP